MGLSNDQQCEQRICAAMMQKKEWLLDIVSEVKPDDFFFQATRDLYIILYRMHSDGEEVNASSVLMLHGPEVQNLNFGRSFIHLATDVLMLHEVKSYIKRLHELRDIRSLMGVADTLKLMIQNGESAENIYKTLEDAVISHTVVGNGRTLIMPDEMAEACVMAVTERMDDKERNKKMLYTSFKNLNYATGGFEKGDLVIMSAETGGGKSAFAMNICRDIGITQKRPVFYLNSEMSKEQMALRWSAFLGHVSHSKLRNGSTSEEEFKQVEQAAGLMNSSSLYTLNMPDMQIAGVLAEIRRMKNRYNIEIAIVDYIGRMEMLDRKDVKDWQVLTNAARQLKTIAQELDITVVMVAQLTGDGGKLAQASYMEHEADLWLNIQKIPESDLPMKWPWNSMIEFRKARNAERGKQIAMRFYGDMLAFTDDRKEAETFCNLEGFKPMGPAQFGQTVPKKKWVL